jgi:hypothetical protein
LPFGKKLFQKLKFLNNLVFIFIIPRGGLVTGDNSNPAAAPKLLKTRDYFTCLAGTDAGGEHRVYVSNPVLSMSTGQKPVIAGASVTETSAAIEEMAANIKSVVETLEQNTRNVREPIRVE